MLTFWVMTPSGLVVRYNVPKEHTASICRAADEGQIIFHIKRSMNWQVLGVLHS
jgi:hypothetical protein